MNLYNHIDIVLCVLMIRNAFGSTCDKDHPCPAGYICRSISYLPGVKACLHKTNFDSGSAKRAGRCPPKLAAGGTACSGNEDCAITKKCCPIAYGGLAYCVDSVSVDPRPTVTALIEGSTKVNADQSSEFVGSSTLIQSRGYNILVDTGSARTSDDILRNLWSKVGLTFDDMDTVVITHGHPDHFSGLNIFSNVDQVFDGFSINGKMYRANPMAEGKRFFLNDDPDVEAIKTPGHTPQCITILVRNVQGRGTVAVVGDLFVYKNDDVNRFVFNATLADENRKKVACMSDYIVPGHGPIFRVDSQMKSKFGCLQAIL